LGNPRLPHSTITLLLTALPVVYRDRFVGFGLIGFLGIFMLFEGDRFKAPPVALAVLSFCFAVSIGAVWEIFEFSMD